jgi:hypothetical protein
MRLFRSEQTPQALLERADAAARRVSVRLRRLAELLVKAADVVETARVKSKGYQAPQTYLERVPKKP